MSPTGTTGAPGTPAGAEALPEIANASIDRLESEIFGRIADERTHERAKRTRRGRLLFGVGTAAAVVAVAAIIAPTVGGLVRPVGTDAGVAAPELIPALPGSAPGLPEMGAADGESISGDLSSGGAEAQEETDATARRDIIASASATVRVDDVETASDEITALPAVYGGYVEGLNVGTDGGAASVPDGSGLVDPSMAYPMEPRPGYGWVAVRVPADDLQSMIDDLDGIGEVSSVSVGRTDVTDQAIDLRAQVDATRASVERLTELMSETGSLADLIAAETALSDRQALLEGYEQQLAQLDDQVAMSSLRVDLSTVSTPVEADPAGFGDGFVTGWNGLIATLNGIVIAVGFLIPWLVVIGVVGGIVRFLVRLGRRRRAARADDGA